MSFFLSVFDHCTEALLQSFLPPNTQVWLPWLFATFFGPILLFVCFSSNINKLCVCDIFSGGPLYMDTQMKGSTVLIISKHSFHMYYVRNLTGQGYFKIN